MYFFKAKHAGWFNIQPHLWVTYVPQVFRFTFFYLLITAKGIVRHILNWTLLYKTHMWKSFSVPFSFLLSINSLKVQFESISFHIKLPGRISLLIDLFFLKLIISYSETSCQQTVFWQKSKTTNPQSWQWKENQTPRKKYNPWAILTSCNTGIAQRTQHLFKRMIS